VKWTKYVTLMRDMRNAYKVLFREPEEKRALVRSRRECESNIKMSLKKIRV
jgi:hypothetical protein